MAFLHEMPEDILRIIISYIHNPKDITALSIQFRRVHPLCDLPLRRKYRRIRIRNDHQSDKAFHILLSILRKPRLGLFVHRLEVDRQARWNYSFQMEEWQRSLSDTELTSLKDAISSAFEPQETHYVLNLIMQDPRTRNKTTIRRSGPEYNRPFMVGQALAAVLITVCPNLERLVLVASQSHPPTRHQLIQPPLDLLLRRVKSSKGQSNLLQSVRSIDFLSPNLNSRDRFPTSCSLVRSMRLVRRLPNLSSVSIAGMVKLDGPVYMYRGEWSRVRCIQLHDCDLNTQHLASLLCCVERLRKFTYTPARVNIETGSVFSPTEPPQMFNPATLLRCILRHKDFLEHLDLDLIYESTPFGFGLPVPVDDRVMREKYLEHPETRRPPAPLDIQSGSLLDCIALTRLKIDVVTLFYFADGLGSVSPRSMDDPPSLASQLPPGLCSLRVRGYEAGRISYYDRQLWSLPRQARMERPWLRDIKGIKTPIKHTQPLAIEPGFFRAPKANEETSENWTDYEY
ncbi:hypothetical protein BJY04DRAFT_181004 [Aspergillus karnatakaensis]|uniref:uncharacterized protein n=1 Tax=Aspergillus karnatakaensis TaxID=1810916 RepID=UPI003CCDA086